MARLRIGAAAAAVNRSVSTLRRWEAEGRLVPARDDAGHRVYELADVRAVAGGERPAARAPARPAAVSGAPNAIPFLDGLDWLEEDDEEDEAPAPAPAPAPRPARADEAARRVRAARADVEVERARRELDALAAERDAEQARRTREAETAAERARLDGLRDLGRRYALEQGAPAATVAAVTADLSGYVTGARFPTYVPDGDAAGQVRARVERRLAPWRERQERERERERQHEARERTRGERRATVAALIQRGETWATLHLLGWHPRDAAKAMREVQEALRDSVGHDWTEADVIELVRELLDEWE